MSRILFFSCNDGSVSLRATSLPALSFIYLFSVLWNHFCFFVRPLRFNLLYFCFCDQFLFLRWCRTTKSKKGERKWKRWRREDIVVRGKEREKREHCYTSCVFHRNSSYCQFNIVFLLVLIGGYASNGAPGQGPQSEGDSSNTTVSFQLLHLILAIRSSTD